MTYCKVNGFKKFWIEDLATLRIVPNFGDLSARNEKASKTHADA